MLENILKEEKDNEEINKFFSNLKKEKKLSTEIIDEININAKAVSDKDNFSKLLISYLDDDSFKLDELLQKGNKSLREALIIYFIDNKIHEDLILKSFSKYYDFISFNIASFYYPLSEYFNKVDIQYIIDYLDSKKDSLTDSLSIYLLIKRIDEESKDIIFNYLEKNLNDEKLCFPFFVAMDEKNLFEDDLKKLFRKYVKSIKDTSFLATYSYENYMIEKDFRYQFENEEGVTIDTPLDSFLIDEKGKLFNIEHEDVHYDDMTLLDYYIYKDKIIESGDEVNYFLTRIIQKDIKSKLTYIQSFLVLYLIDFYNLTSLNNLNSYEDNFDNMGKTLYKSLSMYLDLKRQRLIYSKEEN